jgi:hypothetical protein
LSGPTLDAYGVFVTAPSGWDVGVGRRPSERAETTHAVLHAATFPLPRRRADYGDGAVQLMGQADVFVALVEFAPSALGTALFAERGWPAPLAGRDFSRTSLQLGIAGQAGVQRWFTDGGRPWCLYVVIGSWADRAALAARANGFLRQVKVRQQEASAGPGGGP